MMILIGLKNVLKRITSGTRGRTIPRLPGIIGALRFAGKILHKPRIHGHGWSE
jgi:hypothetical protein